MPHMILWVALAWLVLLVSAFFLFKEIHAVANFFPPTLGELPFSVIWFGAVGGLLISLQGIFEHNRKWYRSYDYWHMLRPVMGAFMGTLGCLIFIVLNNAATTNAAHPNATFYAVIALVLGYREGSFRGLVTRLVDTIIVPSEKQSPGGGKKDPADK
jgi:hypothetical protein